MPPLQVNATSTSSKHKHAERAAYTIRANDLAEVLCHRKTNGVEEYLVRWRTQPIFPRPPYAPLSWHELPELYDALHHVQIYIETLPSPSGPSATAVTALTSSRKRKAPGGDPEALRDFSSSGLLTPGASTSDRSRSPADSGIEADKSFIDHSNDDNDGTTVTTASDLRAYNAVFRKKGGYIIPKSVPRDERVNSRNLPTPKMLRVAASTPFSQAEEAIRFKFMEMLKPIKSVYLENAVDRTTPSLNFTFIKDYVIRDGVRPLDPDTLIGCSECSPNMGANCGCEYPGKCHCLEYAAVDEQKLERTNPGKFAKYKYEMRKGGSADTEGLPKRFPYSRPNKDSRLPQTLVKHYRESRHPIYECNERCACGPICKSRLVQKGRRVGLTIFKTEGRGWGVYCNEKLVKGEFVDTYLGEVITSEEATRREDRAGSEKNSYLYSLDKFVGDIDPRTGSMLENEDCYIVDGQYMGTPTRFINHSCEPNCCQYTVSYNKYDIRVYQLAFFAYEDIKEGTELTFDYMDEDEVEENVAIARRLKAEADPKSKNKIQCNCGATKCRGFLWKQDAADDNDDNE